MKAVSSLLMLCVTALVSSTSFAQNSVVLKFSDTPETSQVIEVRKTDSDRVFFQCTAEIGMLNNCVEINRIKVFSFESQEQYLDSGFGEGFLEGSGATIGTIGGLVVGIFGALAFDDPIAPKGGWKIGLKQAAFLVAAVYIGNRGGHAIGDWIDGEEFSALETSALLLIMGNDDIISNEVSGDVDMSEMSLETFRSQLHTATYSLISRPDRRIDTPWAPF